MPLTKLDIAAGFGPIRPVNLSTEDSRLVVDELTDGWGANVVFETSSSEHAANKIDLKPVIMETYPFEDGVEAFK
jgi:threonine dehydrogenase-like Zn-dependent dehydrogenase